MAYTDCTKIKIGASSELTGYSSYDVKNSLTYVQEPARTVAGNLVGLDGDTFIVTTIKFTYNMIPYDKYKTLVTALTTSKDFKVTYYDVDSGSEKSGMFYLAPATDKDIFVRNKNIYGIRNFSVELISSNNEVPTS